MYRPAKSGRAFSIFDPTLRGANVENDKVVMLSRDGAWQSGHQMGVRERFDQLRDSDFIYEGLFWKSCYDRFGSKNNSR